MANPTVEDYRWLVSDDAKPFLTQAAESASSLVATTKRLREVLSPERTHLVLELLELRERARVKFSSASNMFFTRKLLEQATDERIAAYKSGRFASDARVADLCCGMGGDAIALAGRGSCLAIDRDPIAVALTEANARAVGVDTLKGEVADVAEISQRLDCSAWHIDPDRRVTSKRTSQTAYSEPSLDVIAMLLNRMDAGAMKLAPGAELPEHWCEGHPIELEWIGSRRECRQQVAWMGRLASETDAYTATIVDVVGKANSFSGDPAIEPDVGEIDQFIYTPDSTLVASGLTGALAGSLGLQATTIGASYFSSSSVHDSPFFQVFAVQELLSLDVKKLRRLLRERNIGSLEIKTRGVDVSPHELRRKLHLKGANSSSLLIFKRCSDVVAALAERVQFDA